MQNNKNENVEKNEVKEEELVRKDNTASNNKGGKRNAKQKNRRNSSRKGGKQNNASNAGAPVRNKSSMYFTDPNLAAMVSNFSFNQFIGQKPIIPDNTKVNIPGFCTLLINPSPMWSDGNLNDGVNMAGLKWYTYLSASNAKTTQYAPQDVMTLILAMGEVISTIEAAKRAIGLALVYNVRNRLFPKGAIKACGFDEDDLVANLANYRIRLNTIINVCNSIPIPSGDVIQYFEKCKTIYQTLFTDAESPMSQIYLFRQYSTWELDETSYDQGSVLKTVQLYSDNAVMTMDAFLNELESMVNLLLTSSTFNYIYSDMLRVMDPSKLYKFEGISSEYSVIPEYNPMMLLQIHNAEFTTRPVGKTLTADSTPNNDVYPEVSSNSLRYQPQFQNPWDVWSHARVVDFPHSMGNPDVDQVIDSTRYKCAGTATLKDSAYTTSTVYMGDHYPVIAEITNGDGTILRSAFSLSGNSMNIENARFLACVSQFDYAPVVYIYDTSADKVQPNCLIGDLDYFTTVDRTYLRRVNDLCAQGLFTLRQ